MLLQSMFVIFTACDDYHAVSRKTHNTNLIIIMETSFLVRFYIFYNYSLTDTSAIPL